MICGQLTRSLPQQFRRLRNTPSEFVNSIEDSPGLSIFARAPDNRENAFPKFSRKLCYSRRGLPLKRLSIQTSFARDHKIDIFHFRLEANRFRHDLKPRSYRRAAKAHQTKP